MCKSKLSPHSRKPWKFNFTSTLYRGIFQVLKSAVNILCTKLQRAIALCFLSYVRRLKQVHNETAGASNANSIPLIFGQIILIRYLCGAPHTGTLSKQNGSATKNKYLLAARVPMSLGAVYEHVTDLALGGWTMLFQFASNLGGNLVWKYSSITIQWWK